jgi:thioredoxin reductase (NADPH)
VVTLADGSQAVGRTVIIATGATYRRVDVPGVDEFVGAGVFYGAAVSEAPAMTGTQVYVVGAGNSAGQTAIHLARFADRSRSWRAAAPSAGPCPTTWSKRSRRATPVPS